MEYTSNGNNNNNQKELNRNLNDKINKLYNYFNKIATFSTTGYQKE